MADDYDDNDDQTDLVPRAHIRQLEEKAKRAAELENRLAEVERQAAFAEALGTAAGDPKMRYFKDGYKGELTAEAIRAEAVSAGFISTPGSQPEQQQQTEDLSAHARMASNAAGGSGIPVTDWQAALADADRIPNEADRTQAILDAVERFGGRTSNSAQ